MKEVRAEGGGMTAVMEIQCSPGVFVWSRNTLLSSQLN